MNLYATVQNQKEEREPEQLHIDSVPKVYRINPRLVFTDPDAFFGRDLYHDLLMEQQEQM